MWIIYTFETQKVEANPVQLDFYGFLAWAIVQRVTLPLCIFHRFHSAVTLAEIWKTSYKARLEWDHDQPTEILPKSDDIPILIEI